MPLCHRNCNGSDHFSVRMFLVSAFGLDGPRSCKDCKQHYDRKVNTLTIRLTILAITTGIIGSFAEWWGFAIPEEAFLPAVIFSLVLAGLVVCYLFSSSFTHETNPPR